MKVVIVWFRRDLRLSDNPAWIRACREAERVVPVHVHDPGAEGDWAPGAASRWWLHHSLDALDAALHGKGSRLLFLTGTAETALTRLARRAGAGAVYFNRLYEPGTRAQEARVRQALESAGVVVAGHNASLLFEPGAVTTGAGGPYRVFTPFWRRCREQGLETRPERAPGRVPGLPASLPRDGGLNSFGLLPRIRWDRGLAETWQPGEAGAGKALRRFVRARLADYPAARDRPADAGTSGLSPHLHFGEIGPRQVVAMVARHAGSGLHDGSAGVFLAEIGWREFAHHLLFHFPRTPDEPLDERFRHFPWAGQYRNKLDAWRRGRTGIPMVDAGMRQLWHTGWMHNRVRMVVASFLSKNLLVPWREGARWFWDTLVDADLANNTLGWQWTAGCGADAAPFFRIFNPVLQGERHDPEGAYIRRWVPELREVPGRRIHSPWQLSTPPAGYPAPIVDLQASRRAALAAFETIKRRPGGGGPV
jgi:deoxyribodipyrimidine photo-lyase